MQMSKPYYRPADLQRLLGISRKSVYALCFEPGFPAYRIGKRNIVIDPEGLEAWLKNRKSLSDARKTTET